jgi:3-deoxy-D-manno-octulosonic-acid transferase
MWQIIYNVLITLFLPFVVLFGLTKKKIRANLRERLFPSVRKGDIDKTLWVHAASIGEAIIADNLIRYMSKQGQAQRFLITTNTHYTKDLLVKKTYATTQTYALPLDFFFSVKRFLNREVPKCLLIIETEIWPNLIWQVKRLSVPIIIINGRISDRTFKNYLTFSFFMKTVLSHIDLVLAQSEEHRERFIKIGMDPVRVVTTGNIKYFRESEDIKVPTERKKIVTFGSIKEKELDAVYKTIREVKSIFPDYQIFIAPRELHLTNIIEKDLSSSFSVVRYSTLRNSSDSDADIIIVDTIGDLLHVYSQSRVAFVGGSLAPYGGQNVLEPLFFATPVLFGPFMENFKDIAQSVIKQNAGIMVHSADELTKKTAMLLNDDDLRRKMGENARLVIEQQQQVMKKTIELIETVVKTGQLSSC